MSLPPALRWGSVAALLAIAAIFPLVFTSELVTQIAVDTLIFAGAAAAWNIFSGYSGYISLGHAVFFGAGAYTAGVAAQDWQISGSAEFLLLPLAAAVAAVIAVPFGLIALRVRRHTFVVVTIAVFFIFQLMAFNLAVTGGSVGINAPFLGWAPATYNNPFYYLALIIAVGTTALSWLIRRSRFGLQLRAIRDDEDRARGLGVQVMRVKLSAFIISAVVMGLVGALWFFFIVQVLPQYGFDPLLDLSVALMAFLGGLGRVAGPVLGALILEPGQQYLTLHIGNSYLSEIILGALFLLVILFLPRGIIPFLEERVTAWRGRAAARAPDTVPASPAGEHSAQAARRGTS
ncbi:MAG TPA: branched-chain amino acid ABC transporter permease [Streptosporangiaceae bacterium]|jgi:branched-chain amino acid transport system permease protein